MILENNWEYLDIGEMAKDRDKYEGADTLPVKPYDLENYLEHAGGVELGDGQYIIDPDYQELMHIEDFDDLIRNKS